MAFWHRTATAAATEPPRVPSAPAWTTLPVLQRVVEPIAPVAPREPFVASLASHHSPSFLAPLAHVIDPDGPSGRIAGLITAAPAAPAPPVQRSAHGEGSVIKRWIARPRSTPTITSAAPVQRAAAEEAASMPAVEWQAEPEVEPIASVPDQIEVPVPTPSAIDNGAPAPQDASTTTTRPSAAAATALAPHTTPSVAANAPVQRAVDDAETHQHGLIPLHHSGSPRSSVPVQETPLRAVVQRTATGESPATRAVDGSAQPGRRVAADPPVQRAVAEAGVPLALTPAAEPVSGPQAQVPVAMPDHPSSPPALPMLQRHASSGDAASPSAETDYVQRSIAPAAVSAAVSAVAPSPPSPSAAPAPSMALPDRALPAADDWSGPSAPAQLADEPAPEPESRPLLGAADESVQLVASSVPVQRTEAASPPSFSLPVPPQALHRAPHAVAPGAPTVQTARPLGFGSPLTAAASAPAPAGPSAPVEPVTAVQWSAGRTAMQPVQRAVADAGYDSPATTAGTPLPETISLLGERSADLASTSQPASPTDEQSFSIASPAPVPVPTPMSMAAVRVNAAPHAAAVQRTLGLGAPLAAAPPTLAAPVRHLQRETAITRPPAAAHWDAGSAAVAAGVAQRAADGSVEFGAVPLVQRDADDAAAAPPEPAPEPPPAASSPAASSAPSAPPPAPAAGGGQNIDDLVRRLYDPLAARLKAELRLDRERAGLVTDLRRP